MIVKNEEDVLARCLTSVKGIFDQIVVVDTGSSDNTVAIAKQFTSDVYFFKWVNDFSLARNFSFSKATGDYVIWLDADDVVLPQDAQKLKALKTTLTGETDCYFLKYALSQSESEKPNFVFYRERILKNDGTFFWSDPVHEVISPHGKTQYCDITITHKKMRPTATDRNLKIYEALLKSGKPLTARQKFYYSRELYYNAKWLEATNSFEEFLQAYNGWKENNIEACLTKAKCYWQLGDTKNTVCSLTQSFLYDTPRAEILCELGNVFTKTKQYKQSIFWLEQAKKCKPNVKSGGFVMLDCYNFLPNLLLCVCYYQMGNLKRAKQYHLLCEKQNPNHPSVLHNKQFFKDV